MNTKSKTAVIATLLNTVFTLVKFALYFATGSLAVLADAWHSFSDIASSVLLLFAFLHDDKVKNAPIDNQTKSTESLFDTKQTPTEGTAPSSEVLVSLAIGLILFLVSAAIYHRGTVALPFKLESTLPAGCFFLFCAFCSYALSRFEQRVGQTEGSIGLLADASHSKADMIAALLTGLSLIFHSAGLNLDRPAAYIIATLILGTAIETIMNSLFAIARHDNTLIHRHKMQDLVIRAIRPATWASLLRKLEKHSDKGRTISVLLTETLRWGSLLIILMLIAPFATSTFFVLEPAEQAILERFGVPQQNQQPLGPGLHAKLPWPIDQIIVCDTKRIQTIQVGAQTAHADTPLLWTRQHGGEEPFLSADNSFFYPYASVNYTVTNLYAFLFSQRQPEDLIRHATSQIMTRESLSQAFYDLSTKHRALLEERISTQLQQYLNTFHCGIHICDVFLRDIHPPIPISPAFENVVAAYQEQQQLINEAYGYHNGTIPAARGNAQRLVAEAEAEAAQIINQAEGQTQRQLSQLASYDKNPELVRRKQYAEAIKKALAAQSLIVIDPAAGRPDLWATESAYRFSESPMGVFTPDNNSPFDSVPYDNEFYEEEEQ